MREGRKIVQLFSKNVHVDTRHVNYELRALREAAGAPPRIPHTPPDFHHSLDSTRTDRLDHSSSRSLPTHEANCAKASYSIRLRRRRPVWDVLHVVESGEPRRLRQRQRIHEPASLKWMPLAEDNVDARLRGRQARP